MERREISLPDEAAGWDARLRAPDCSEAERAAFKRWCQLSLDNQQRFDQLQNMLSELRDARDAPEIRALRESALNAAPPLPAQRRWLGFRGPGKVAAVALLAIGLFYLAVNAPYRPAIQLSPSYATAVGERSTTTFDDGSVTVLNTDTRLQVAYSDQERRVTLLKGQALFDVAKDPQRPFVVVAGEQRITAIGTVFDVRLDGDDLKVTLVEGVVEVLAHAPLGIQLTDPSSAPAPVLLAAGQQLSTTAIATQSQPIVESADVERATIWRQGRVFFEDAPLSEAIAEMNRYSSTQIVLGDTGLDAYRVSGMFRTGQQTNFVDALEVYFPLTAERAGLNQIILRQGNGQ